MAGRKDGDETKGRILEAACEVFADKGFRDATHAEICSRCGANTAAINYHFRSKESLYVEAWRAAFQKSLALHPPDGGVPQDAPALERFRGQIMSIVDRASDPACRDFDIAHKEMSNPTGLLKEVMRECITPLKEKMEGMVRELLGKEVSEEEVRLCEMSVMGQCFNPVTIGKRRKEPHPCGTPFSVSTETLVDHIVRFSLAGMESVKKRRAGAGKTQG